MFKIRQEQFDSFKVKSRKEFADDFVATLKDQGVDAKRSGGDQVLVNDARGFQTRFYLREDGLVEKSVSPEGVESRFELDDQGRLSRLSRPSGYVELGRKKSGLIDEIRSDGVSYQLDYDTQNRPTKLQYPDGKQLRVEYNPASTQSRVVYRSGAERRVVESNDGTTLIDALGRERIYKAKNGSLEEIQFPDGTSQRYEASADGSILNVIQRDGSSVMQFNDEKANDLVVVWPDEQSKLFQYTDDNLLSYVASTSTIVGFDYDDAQNLKLEVTPAGETQFENDGDGRLVKLTNALGSEFEYEYDGDGRLSKLVAWGKTVEVHFDDKGLPDALQYPNEIRQELQLNSRGQLKKTSLIHERRKLSTQEFNYDQCEKLTDFAESWFSGQESEEDCSRNIKIHFDDEWRVLAEECLNSGKKLSQFEYDIQGNMTAFNGAANEIGLMDELRSFGGQPIRYDELGNMLELPGAFGRIQTEFTASGLLKKSVCKGVEVRYQYDPLGRRTVKTDGKQTWRYGWGGTQMLLEEYRESPDAEPIVREYLYLPSSFEPFGFRENGRLYWMQSDSRGAVVAVVDEDGELVWRATYDSFGNATIHIEKVRQPWRLNGQYFDDETGLHYNHARYYSPVIKSYLSLDPLWFRRATTNYSYCGNDPWNRFDPTGAAAPAVAAVVAVLAVGAGVTAFGAVAGAGSSYMAGDDPWAGAVEGALPAFGGYFGAVVGGLFLGPVGAIALGVICSAIGAGVAAALGVLIRRFNRGDSFAIECWPEIVMDILWAVPKAMFFDVIISIMTLGLGKLFAGPVIKAMGKTAFVKQLAGRMGREVQKMALDVYTDAIKPFVNVHIKGGLNTVKKLTFSAAQDFASQTGLDSAANDLWQGYSKQMSLPLLQE